MLDAIIRAYRRPHRRHTRDLRWITARLICYPILAAFGVVAIAGAGDPAIFTDTIVDGARLRVIE